MLNDSGFYNLKKDKEAIEEFKKEVEERMVRFPTLKDRMDFMITNNYYYDLYSQYTIDEIEEIHQIAYDYKFEFQSYMAISKFYSDYALKTNDKQRYLETYEDRVAIVALYLAQGNMAKARRYCRALIEQRYQPATPTFLNSGKARRGEMVSCFLLEMDDSLNSINFNLGTAMQLSKIGGGVALNLSKLRGRTETIKDIKGAAKGVLPVMKLLEDAFSYADQMGQRKGAGAVYYNIFGWDVMEVLDSKKINADEKQRIKSLSVGLIVPQKFLDLAKENKPMYVFAPRTVYEAYGQHLDDMDIDEMYDDLLNNPKVRKKMLEANGNPMTARDLLIKIAMIQFESGYPYIMFKTNANKQHPLKRIGQIKMSNLCTEIFQLMETSYISDYGEPDIIGRDISCNLGSLNIVNVMEHKNIRDSVHVGMEMLTDVTDMTSITNAPGVKRANEEFHSVGLGMMNLHGFLAKNKIAYESKEARDFARVFAAMVNFYSIEKSMMIAKERGVTFKDFEKSDYATGEYFDMYLQKEFLPETERVKQLFEGIYIPTKEDWAKLKEDVMKYGLYHAYRLAIAPTQSISYIQNATSSVMPVVEHIESRTYGNSTTYYPMPYLSEETYFYYKSAYDMDMYRLIDLIAEIQPHVDQGISTILYVKSSTSTRELARLYLYAAKKGLKSLYYTRTKNENLVQECVSCAV